jgi:hypothetical protein
VPDIEQGQADSKPDPVAWDTTAFRIAQEEKERWSCQAPEDAPPLVVFDEEIANVVNQDQDDCDCLQPVSVVNGVCAPDGGRGVVFCV